MTLLQLTEPVFQYICRLNRIGRRGSGPRRSGDTTFVSLSRQAAAAAAPVVAAPAANLDYSVARADVKALFEDMMSQAATDLRLSQQARKLELPLIFFVDSMISESGLPFASEWNQNRLAFDRQELAGDEKFFDLLDETLKDGSEDGAERLAVFYVCIGLGFTGIYFRQPEFLRKMMLSIAPRVRHLVENDQSAKICPEAYEKVDTRDLVVPPSSRMLLVGLLFGGLALSVLISYIVVYKQASNSLNDSIRHVLLEDLSPDAAEIAQKTMEQILKILRQRTEKAGVLGSIPKPIRVSLMCFGVFVGGVVIFKYARLKPSELTFLIIAVIFLAIITGGYYAWQAWTKKKHNQQFGGEISQHSSATPRGLSDPGQRARLDDMRKKFQSGVEAYKSRGKDLYNLPWYVIVGEPGSGKTEAIRHCNVGFPPGMQDEFQGVGGTINMNWWFTNQAVLLDTAGRLMFEDVKPGETSEWKEFLTLLKKNRPNCPINGLLLVIPSDSLIKDSADSIQKKAGKIAQQLAVIQTVLDVRFPVFVVVTKCDKINGFREFFDGLTDPQLQHQMMGWSNPDPLDEPFKPEMVDKHLDQVAVRLRRRRLGLLRDPVPENSDGRRTDEVDSLYALPHSLELLSSRLRRYLETIFIAGPWSPKPLFLRGIYFSSAMREGAALDAELAEAIGVSVEELPEGKVWERDRAYFLRDLFVEKVFREKSLVTRASNTKQMLRSQQIALGSFALISLVLFSTFAWFAMGDVRTRAADHAKLWQAVSSRNWDNHNWNRAIVTMRGDGKFASGISTNRVEVEGEKLGQGEFQLRLQKVTETPLQRRWMLPGLSERYNRDRSKAQRIVFETGVVRPLVEGARQKMEELSQSPQTSRDDGESKRQTDALVALIQLEADILSRGAGTNTGQLTPETATNFLGAFQNFIEDKDLPVNTNLAAVMVWTYSTNDTAKGSWPPAWLSGGRGGINTLTENVGIKAGVGLFERSATNIQRYEQDWEQISTLNTNVTNFAASESVLFDAAKRGEEAKFLKAHVDVQQTRKALDDQVRKALANKFFAESLSLTNAHKKFSAELGSSAAAAMERVTKVNTNALNANKNYALFIEIKRRLESVQASLGNRVAQLLTNAIVEEFPKLDADYLNRKAFAQRAELYDRAARLMNDEKFGSANDILIGSKGQQLEKFLANRLGPVRNDATNYSGNLKDQFNTTIEYYLTRAENAQSRAFFVAYLAEAKTELAKNGFPLVRDPSRVMSVEKFVNAARNLTDITNDFASPVFQKHVLREAPDEWKRFKLNVEGQQAVANALSDGGRPAPIVISLVAYDENQPTDQWRNDWRDMKLIFGGGDPERVITQSPSDQPLGEVSVDRKLELRWIKNAGVPNSPTASTNTGDWGPMWLIDKFNGERNKTNPTIWQLELPIPGVIGNGTIRLKIKFPHALPELDKWLTQ